MKTKVLEGRVTNVSGDTDGAGNMHIALAKPGAKAGETVPAGHVTVRLPEEDAGDMWPARKKRVRVTIEVLEE